MLDSLIPALAQGIIELLNKHQLSYINKPTSESSRHKRVIVAKKKRKRVITICIANIKSLYYVEILLHNTARTNFSGPLFTGLDKKDDVPQLERSIKPIYIGIDDPEIFEHIELYILKSLE